MRGDEDECSKIINYLMYALQTVKISIKPGDTCHVHSLSPWVVFIIEGTEDAPDV